MTTSVKQLNKEQFLKKNQGLLKTAARKYFFETPKFSFDDLVSVANIAALRALDSYDEGRAESKVETYVYWAVSRDVRDFVRKNKHDVYVSCYEQRKHHKNVSEGKTSDLFSGPNSPTAVRLDYNWNVDRPESDSNKFSSFESVLPSGSPPPEQQILVEEQKKILMEEINKLSENERYVILERHFQGKTYPELGEDLGLSKQRIAQIDKKALSKLKSKLEHRLDGFVARSDGLARR